MSGQVLVLRDDLLLVAVDRLAEMEALRAYADEHIKKLGVEILVFGHVDLLRSTPEKIVEAAKLVEAWLAEQSGSET